MRSLKLMSLVLLSVLLFPSLVSAKAFPSLFAFGPDSGWVIVYEHGNNWGYRGERLPPELGLKIEEMAKDQYILGVAMNSTGWAVFGTRTMEYRNVPQSFVDYIRQCRADGYQILDAALSDDGWVILSRDSRRSHRWKVHGDVPKRLTDVMRRTSEEGGVVLGVGLTLNNDGFAVTIRRPGQNNPIYMMWHCPTDAIRYTDEIDEM